MSLATVVPIAVASTNVTAVVESLIDRDVVREATQHDNTSDIFAHLPDDTIMVVTPGTDDTMLMPRNLPYAGNRQALIVNYTESFGPVIAGRSNTIAPFSPGYDESKEHAMNQNLAVMAAFAEMGEDRPFVVYTGYSQGADVLGDAAENPRAYDDDFFVPGKDMVVLVSDPRSPWGIKAWLDAMPWLKPIVEAAGIEANGARDPEATGKVEVVSVIIVGDPVSNFQWVSYRPVASLIVNAAGFLTIHSGTGPHTYGDVERLGDPKEYKSGNTTYLVYDAAHPLALLVAAVHDQLGITYDKDDLARWDELAEAYYPTQAPNPDTAAVPVTAVDSVKQDRPGDGYTVTVPSEVATGAEKPGDPPRSGGFVPGEIVPPPAEDVPTDDRTPADNRGEGEPGSGDADDRPGGTEAPDSEDSGSGSGSGSGSEKPDSGDSGAGDSGSPTGGDDSSSAGMDREKSDSAETSSAGGDSTGREAA
ncbi:PE-PPE domain-containing protein [Gordonia sp. GONU]|uniref:PE-PPE domain-containing protein n=1 Tax=Gordonia sp. GONU TaxID=2972949 RepID=UPI0021AC2613|nr:PE-PPE domain-containing protein [Gordonia sp. GONU]MCR8899050.1 PE-PPE domain-containing protein [Gordonia sp. GONU]